MIPRRRWSFLHEISPASLDNLVRVESMDRSSRHLPVIAAAMMILGFVAEVVGIALLANGRPVAAAAGVLVSGFVLIMLGGMFYSMSRGE